MKEEVQSFFARIIHLCHYVKDANTTTDLQLLKDVADRLEKEAYGMSKTFAP